MAQQIETDDAVRVDVRVHWYGSVGASTEDYLRRLWEGCLLALHVWQEKEIVDGRKSRPNPTYWILRTELELQPVGLVHVEGIRVQNFEIEEPFFESLG